MTILDQDRTFGIERACLLQGDEYCCTVETHIQVMRQHVAGLHAVLSSQSFNSHARF